MQLSFSFPLLRPSPLHTRVEEYFEKEMSSIPGLSSESGLQQKAPNHYIFKKKLNGVAGHSLSDLLLNECSEKSCKRENVLFQERTRYLARVRQPERLGSANRAYAGMRMWNFQNQNW